MVEYLRGHGTMAELFATLSSVDVAVQSIGIEDDGERGRPRVRRTVLHVATDDLAALASVAEGLHATWPMSDGCVRAAPRPRVGRDAAGGVRPTRRGADAGRGGGRAEMSPFSGCGVRKLGLACKLTGSPNP